jgi:hypothetical protein
VFKANFAQENLRTEKKTEIAEKEVSRGAVENS